MEILEIPLAPNRLFELVTDAGGDGTAERKAVMKPAAFRYFAPRSLEEALALLAEHGDEAKILAGGQSLVPAMNFRLAQPACS